MVSVSYHCLVIILTFAALCSIHTAALSSQTKSSMDKDHEAGTTIDLQLNDGNITTIQKGSSQSFCYEPNRFVVQLQSVYYSLFNDLFIRVAALDEKSLRSYSVRGVSLDDVQIHLEQAIRYLLKRKSTNDKLANPVEKTSVVRDLVSSCPSPWSTNPKVCMLRFSSIDKSCVTVYAADRSLRVVVDAYEEYNPRYLLYLVVALGLIYSTNAIAKSKVFQVRFSFISYDFLFFTVEALTALLCSMFQGRS